MLEHLRFPGGQPTTVRIDRGVRDYLVRFLRGVDQKRLSAASRRQPRLLPGVILYDERGLQLLDLSRGAQRPSCSAATRHDESFRTLLDYRNTSKGHSVQKYFFTIRRGDWVEDDSDGTYLPDISAALSYAEYTIRGLRKKIDFHDPALMMIVKDQAQQTILSLPFFSGLLKRDEPRRICKDQPKSVLVTDRSVCRSRDDCHRHPPSWSVEELP